MISSDFSEGIYLVDFEFHPAKGKEGNPPVSVFKWFETDGLIYGGAKLAKR